MTRAAPAAETGGSPIGIRTLRPPGEDLARPTDVSSRHGRENPSIIEFVPSIFVVFQISAHND